MASVQVLFCGPPEQRHTIKVTPMTSMASILEEACKKIRPSLDPACYHLKFGKKPVDMSLTFRLANIPAGSRMDIVKSERAPPLLDVQLTATMPVVAAASTDHVDSPVLEDEPSRNMSIDEPPAGETIAGMDEPSGSTIEDGARTALLGTLGISRPLFVFNRAALESTTAPSSLQEDEPDEFFDLTPEDFAALARAAEQKRKEESVFRSRASREAQATARAHAAGPVPVRIHLPHGLILQSTFKPLDVIADVEALVSQCLQPSPSGTTPSFYLYTAPPHTPLKTKEATLVGAGLLPAANVYVHLGAEAAAADASGTLLRPEVSALLQSIAPIAPVGNAAAAMVEASTSYTGSSAAAGQASGSGFGSAAGRGLEGDQAEEAPRVTVSGQRVPKWLKVGK